MAEDAHGARIVWFYRDYRRLSGGHVKHAHYFDHVQRAQGFAPKLTLAGGTLSESLERERQELWPVPTAALAARWAPAPCDLLFLAGTDWRYLEEAGLDHLTNPRVNLIQHVRHAHVGSELYGYLRLRAIRVCVSAEVADAIVATGRTNGPVLTIANGTDAVSDVVKQPNGGRPEQNGQPTILLVGYKRPALAAALSERLNEAGAAHQALTDFLPRPAFLDLLAHSDVAICLPHDQEGFYLPALEAMAFGCVTITLDCIGNRSFCRHGRNCLVAADDVDALEQATHAALHMRDDERQRLLTEARQTVAAHSLKAERSRFQAVLRDIDRLWHSPALQVKLENMPPLVDFMIVGAQKCGTSALAHFLAQHPAIGMSSLKEPHLFDAPEYSAQWSRQDIDERYRPYFAHCPQASVRGEATPIYMYLPDIAAELKRYNRKLKLIVMLRDPVQRAFSAYAMERARGRERLPLWLALLAEPIRRLHDRDIRRHDSAAREHSYRQRGLYSRQLRNLYEHFHADSVLIVRADDLRQRHDATLRQVFRFLGVATGPTIPQEIVNAGDPPAAGRLCRWLLRLSYVADFARLRRMFGVRLASTYQCSGSCSK